MTEIDIFTLASVFYGVTLIARGTYVANVTMLTVGGQYYFGSKIAPLALTLVVRFPTGQAVGGFCLVVFEVVSESLVDVFVNL